MRSKTLLLACLLWAFFFQVSAQTISGEDFVKKTIAYHDPNEDWRYMSGVFLLEQTSPEKPLRKTKITLDNSRSFFEMESKKDKMAVVRKFERHACYATVNGKEPSDEQVVEFRLSEEQIRNYYNYYIYLLGLPMKLNDEGAQIAKEATQATFMGKTCWALKVTYSEEVGKDTWYFYADLNTFALIGCRFYHDESKNDGEYIIFDGELSYENMKFPKNRAWYMNADDKHLGTDTITKIKKL